MSRVLRASGHKRSGRQTEALADAACIHPLLSGWTDDELAVLTPQQRSTTPPASRVIGPVFPEAPSRRPLARDEQADPYHVYIGDDGGVEVSVDASLPAPVIRDDGSFAGLRPIVELDPVEAPAGRSVVYYFEVDTVESFDSPNFWRAPQLLPYKAERDITGRAGVRYSVLRSGHHRPHAGPRLEFPFRVSAMRLPDDWHALDRAELERHAIGLGLGLGRDALIREVFDWVRHTIVWSAQTQVRSTLDVFCTGVGACGQANALCALLLELNGIRTRGVSGFDPLIRARTEGRGGGHSAAEYFDDERRSWNYIDPYLDLLVPGVSAADFSRCPIGDHPLGAFGNLRSLRRQFMYRRYFDRLGRMIPASMLQVQSGEAGWGTQWPLVRPQACAPADVLAERRTVFVRARYLLTEGRSVQHRSERPSGVCGSVVASPWAVRSWTVQPRALLGV